MSQTDGEQTDDIGDLPWQYHALLSTAWRKHTHEHNGRIYKTIVLQATQY